jgi:HAD superfamily hydrolase (TIGR01458 family)
MLLTYNALFLDLSGVLYEGRHAIEGATGLVERARDRGLLLRFVTNTVSKNRTAIISDLRDMGMPIEEDELFTAALAARNYMLEHKLRPYYLLHEAVRSDFADIDQQDPNCVLLGDARERLDYQSLNQAFRLCKQGGPLIGIGMNKYFKDENGLNLDAGPFIRAIEWAADTTAIIMGKPSPQFYAQVVASTPYTAEKCLMVGDDVLADVEGAVKAGLQGCLVRTGKYQPGDDHELLTGARVIDTVADLFRSA